MEQKLKKEPLGKGFFVNVTPHHTFGTDAVLLSNFANARKNDRLVDLGTGCGIIPLLCLRDQGSIQAVGVDISDEATYLAEMTANELGLANFKVINIPKKTIVIYAIGLFTILTHPLLLICLDYVQIVSPVHTYP